MGKKKGKSPTSSTSPCQSQKIRPNANRRAIFATNQSSNLFCKTQQNPLYLNSHKFLHIFQSDRNRTAAWVYSEGLSAISLFITNWHQTPQASSRNLFIHFTLSGFRNGSPLFLTKPSGRIHIRLAPGQQQTFLLKILSWGFTSKVSEKCFVAKEISVQREVKSSVSVCCSSPVF